MLRIKLAEVFVDDQDKAKAFYTDKLGLQVGTDMSVGSYRWLTVVSRDNAGGLELLLSQGDEAAKAFQAARRESGTPATSFSTDDITKEHETLVAKGVTFTTPPTKMEYGGTDAAFEDTCGNLINLHQDD